MASRDSSLTPSATMCTVNPAPQDEDLDHDGGGADDDRPALVLKSETDSFQHFAERLRVQCGLPPRC